MPVFLDIPGDRVETVPFPIAGWIASHSDTPAISVRVQGLPIPFALNDRPDVRQALPLFPTVSGVNALAQLGGTLPDEAVIVELECDGEVAARSCRIVPAGPDGRVDSKMQDNLRSRTRAWCLMRLRCPTCGAAKDRLVHGLHTIECKGCGTAYPQDTAALNMISARARIAAGVVETDNVSSNPYTPDALALIMAATARGGWVLDCGAGSRPERLPGVVNVEIANYRSSDVLAVGEALPFADNSFDAVLSLAVLEHVRDPFACARELVRVLRPGGELLADVPFLQPLHGYPDHYYNMTQAGLRNLFAGLGEVLDCRVPLHGHPIFGVQWLLGAYLAGLPTGARAELASMTVAEVAALRPHDFLARPAAALMPQDAQGIVACLNTLRFRK